MSLTRNASVLTELISFNCATIPRGRRSWPLHLHHFFQLNVLLAGRLTVRVEGKPPWRASAGDGWLMPPLLRHGFESDTGFRQASFKFRLAPAWWSALGRQGRRLRFPDHVRELLEATGRQSRSGTPLAMSQVWAVATLCVVEALRQDERGVAPDATLDPWRESLWPLLELIENEPQAGWSVSRLAAACRMSADHFSRRFHTLLGQTPQRYLLEARIRAAATALLAPPARPIKEIAAASGYATVHAFGAAFKKALGCSPAAYRRLQPEM